MSETSMPMTVRKASNIKKEPARYMSWLCSAEISKRTGRRQRKHNGDQFSSGNDLGQNAADVGDEEIERHAERIFHQRPEFGGMPLARAVVT